MSRYPRAALLVALIAPAAGACGGARSGGSLTTFNDSASYAIGMSMGQSVVNAQAEVDLDILVRGLRETVNEENGALTEGEARAILQRFAAVSREAQETRNRQVAEANLAEGSTFLEENAEKPGIMSTESGLQYEVLEEGDGPQPTADDRVRVHYRGTLLDGTEFDSSYDGDPVSFALRGVIPGWTEGLQLMTVGGKFRFFVPSHLAYGERGSPPRIGPNAVLIFEVELLGIE